MHILFEGTFYIILRNSVADPELLAESGSNPKLNPKNSVKRSLGPGFESESETNFRPDPDPKPDPKLLFRIRNIASKSKSHKEVTKQ
jgi:hypothetical protein